MTIFHQRDFIDRFHVSRETINRLITYEALIQKWNRTINLISKSTVDDIWTRHFRDSAEVYKMANPRMGKWLDIGSGAGFPGAVAAIMAAELAPEVTVTCIESDLRKSEFIRTVARSTKVRLGVLSRRIQESPPHNATIVSARALAPLTELIGLAKPHLAENGRAVFHKGQGWQAEVETALETWRFRYEKQDNPTQAESVILTIEDISRA